MGKVPLLMDCGTVWEQATCTLTSCWSAINRHLTPVFSFPDTRITVTSSVRIGAGTFFLHTSAQRRLIGISGAWPLTPMVFGPTSRITGLLVWVCAKIPLRLPYTDLRPNLHLLWWLLVFLTKTMPERAALCSLNFEDIHRPAVVQMRGHSILPKAWHCR